MIFKSDLIDAINDTNRYVYELMDKVYKLETEVAKLKKKTHKPREDKSEKDIKDTTAPKRRGRPVGSKNKNQPRDKSGKFMKK